MRKIALVLLLLFISTPPAHGATDVIRLTDIPHLNFMGEFSNDSLAQSLTPSGRLGLLVYLPENKSRVWVIDPALIDEVVLMASKYALATQAQPVGSEIAKGWLDQLKKVSANNDVVALPYGNPDIALAKKLAPSELKSYYKFGKLRLEYSLGRPVRSEQNGGWSVGSAKLSGVLEKNYTENRRALTALSKVVNDQQLILLRAQLGRLLAPGIKKGDRIFLAYNARSAVQIAENKLRIIVGEYQLTSEKVNLPVTIVNKFPVAVVVNLALTPNNSRVLVENINRIMLEPSSKKTLSLPVTVIAPGNTIINAQLTDSTGHAVTPSIDLHLNLTVIDSRVVWFTTSAAILLLLAGVAQSVRRIRKARK